MVPSELGQGKRRQGGKDVAERLRAGLLSQEAWLSPGQPWASRQLEASESPPAGGGDGGAGGPVFFAPLFFFPTLPFPLLLFLFSLTHSRDHLPNKLSAPKALPQALL